MHGLNSKFIAALAVFFWLTTSTAFHVAEAAFVLSSDEFEDEFEDDLEDEVEDEIEDEFEDLIEDELEEEFEDAIEDEIEDEFEDSIEDELEDELEDSIQDEIEDEFEDSIEDELEDELEDSIEDEIEDEFEDAIEDELEESIEDEIEDEFEDSIEAEIEDEFEDEFEEFIEDDLEDEFEDFMEDEIEDEFEDAIEDEIEDEFDEEIDDELEDGFDDEFEDEIEDAFDEDREFDDEFDEEDFQDEFDEDLDEPGFSSSDLEDAEVEELLDSIAEKAAELAEDQIDLAMDTFTDEEGRLAFSDEWIVLATPEALLALEAEGYLINETEVLDALGYVIGSIEAPSSFDPAQVRLAGLEMISSPDVVIDRNVIYRPVAGATDAGAAGKPVFVSPRHAIGMIDSSINIAHPVFDEADISQAAFNPGAYELGEAHGTAIASVMVGRSSEFTGYAPGARLFNAAVFSEDPNGSEFSTVVAVTRAINWLLGQDIRIINMSLTGPHNAILERVVANACDDGATIIAAAGNAGPQAAPLYPAAYTCTIAVTAVDDANQPYYRAAQGAYIDFAGPGVRVRHAALSRFSEGGFSEGTGTSFAAAYVTSRVAGLATLDHVREQLQEISQDLGEPGKDPVFGYGLIRNQ